MYEMLDLCGTQECLTIRFIVGIGKTEGAIAGILHCFWCLKKSILLFAGVLEPGS